jgi:hypothetical protein
MNQIGCWCRENPFLTFILVIVVLSTVSGIVESCAHHSDLGKTKWSPYRDDFIAKDWEVIDRNSDNPTTLGRLFRILVG